MSSQIRRCVTYQGSTKRGAKISISNFRTASRESDSSIKEDAIYSELDSPAKKMFRLDERKKDKEVSEFLKFTMTDDHEDARAKMRKRQRLKNESEFNLYTRAVSYSRERALKRNFDSRFKPTYAPVQRQLGMITLNEIMGKRESQSLLAQNRSTRDNYITQHFLNDPELRQKTLQKALLFQRFYDIRRAELPQSSSNASFTNTQVPKRFKNINPRHMRINTEGVYTQENFKRKKYVETKTRLQYFSKAMKAMESDVDNRRRENSDLINMLVEINLNERVEKPQYRDESRLLKRLYLHYSNHQGDDPAELYTHVPLEKVKQFARDFMPEITSDQAESLYDDMKPINIFKLYELLHAFCSIVYGGSRKQLVSQLMKERIIPKRHIFIDPIWQELEKNHKEVSLLHRSDRRIQQATWSLFQRSIRDTLNKEAISFNEVFEMMWEFNIFPNHFAKSRIRYFYEYCCLEKDGLLFDEFTELLNATCLYIERDSDQSARDKILKVYAAYGFFERQQQ